MTTALAPTIAALPLRLQAKIRLEPPPADPCAANGVSLAPDLMLSYTAARSDGLGPSVYVARADGSRPAEMVRGGLAASVDPLFEECAPLRVLRMPTEPVVRTRKLPRGLEPVLSAPDAGGLPRALDIRAVRVQGISLAGMLNARLCRSRDIE